MMSENQPMIGEKCHMCSFPKTKVSDAISFRPCVRRQSDITAASNHGAGGVTLTGFVLIHIDPGDRDASNFRVRVAQQKRARCTHHQVFLRALLADKPMDQPETEAHTNPRVKKNSTSHKK